MQQRIDLPDLVLKLFKLKKEAFLKDLRTH